MTGERAAHAADVVDELFERARELRVLVVGEAIVDEYLYCESIGKSGKEPILAARYSSRESFAGGVLAVANHLAAVCDEVAVLTFLGELDSHETFIRRELDPKVELHALTVANAPTIVKRRFVELYPFQKLFELYVMDGDEFASQSEALRAELEALLPRYDVVVVTDYGHGMIGPDAVRVLCEQARFLAVNTQMNADNRGFNTISKYPRADFVSLSETEMRLEARQRHGDLEAVIRDVSQRLDCPRIVVTRGAEGCLCFDRETGFAAVPAITSTIVDRVGAGDAVLAITALCAAQGVNADVLGVVANAVGAQAVGIVGNRRAIDPGRVLVDVREHLRA